MKPRVLLDVDGVLADFVGAYLKLLEHHTGLVRQRDDVTAFDIGKALGLTVEQASRMKRAIGDAHGFARGLEVYPGAIAGVALLEHVADVYVVTSPWNSNPTWTYDREGWLERHFQITPDRVVHTAAKHLVRGDMLVDDRTETLHAWQDEHPNGLAILWQTPHNRLDGWTRHQTCDWGHLADAVVARARGSSYARVR